MGLSHTFFDGFFLSLSMAKSQAVPSARWAFPPGTRQRRSPLDLQRRTGERNRGLSILKSRGTAHSNQVRELVLSDSGVMLADAYTAGGEVLMGTLRWEKERAETAEREEVETMAKHKGWQRMVSARAKKGGHC
jgi:hypothetical protein